MAHYFVSERCLEDHEVLLQVQSSWPQDGDTKLLFRKNYAKYDFFKKTAVGTEMPASSHSWFYERVTV